MTPQDETGQPKSKLAWLWIVLAVILAVMAVGALWWWKAAGGALAANASLVYAVAANNAKPTALSMDI